MPHVPLTEGVDVNPCQPSLDALTQQQLREHLAWTRQLLTRRTQALARVTLERDQARTELAHHTHKESN